MPTNAPSVNLEEWILQFMPTLAAARGIEPPTVIPQQASAKPATPIPPTKPAALQAASGGPPMLDGSGNPSSPSVGSALAGVQAPPAPEAQRVSSPSAPSPARAPDVTAIMQAIMNAQAQQTPRPPLLSDLLYRRM
jgi:hypothetical protein